MLGIRLRLATIVFLAVQLSAASGSFLSVRTAQAGCIGENLEQKFDFAPGIGSAERRAKSILDERTSEKFPRLEFILKDPDAFIATMKARFEAKKLEKPEHPYQFDFSEIGIPIIRDQRSSIDARLERLQTLKLDFEAHRKDPSFYKQFSKNARYLKKFSEDEIEIAMKHLTELRQEADAYLKAGAVTYQDTLEFSTYCTRALGHFDTRSYSSFIRHFLEVDRGIEGYDQLSAAKEYERYKKRDFQLMYTDREITSSGYRMAGPLYEDAATDPNQLRVIVVPTNDDLNNDVLLRLVSRKEIALAGVTNKPILADGFLRPSGDFWMHDLRHESGKYYEHIRYRDTHHLTKAGERAIVLKQDKWYLELHRAVEEIQDETLRKAVSHVLFNFHHDRGFPMIPSVYLDNKSRRVALGLYSAMTIGREGAPFLRPIKNIKRADRWLRNFWKARLKEEKETLAAPGVSDHTL